MNKTANTLVHHGIKGQRWGVRRYQNEGGSLTLKGKQKNKEDNSKKIATGVAIGAGIGLSAIGISVAIAKGKNYVKKSPLLPKKLSEVSTGDLSNILKELGVSGDTVVNLKMPISKGGWKNI